jgi:hypothetical protein
MSKNKNKQPSTENHYTSLGVTFGLLIGASAGIVIWLVADAFVFFPVFVGAGLSIGIAVGMEMDKTREE